MRLTVQQSSKVNTTTRLVGGRYCGGGRFNDGHSGGGRFNDGRSGGGRFGGGCHFGCGGGGRNFHV